MGVPGIEKFPIPGVSQPGAAGDAAPGSLLGQLRATAAQKRTSETLTLPLPGRWEGKLRVVYGTVGLDELERFAESVGSNASNISGSLEVMARAVRAIEAYDAADDGWLVLEDELGPVTFDDRLARLLDWPRPGDEFTFSARQVYEEMFDGNGFALSAHVGRVAAFMGVVEGEVASGEASTPAGST